MIALLLLTDKKNPSLLSFIQCCETFDCLLTAYAGFMIHNFAILVHSNCSQQCHLLSDRYRQLFYQKACNIPLQTLLYIHQVAGKASGQTFNNNAT